MPSVPGYFDANGNWISSEGRPRADAALPPIMPPMMPGPVQSPTQPPTQPNVQPPTQPPVTTQPQTKLDPFTSWMSQQGLFPYNQAGWSPDMGYNPAATGYNPAAMPNYTMDTPY